MHNISDVVLNGGLSHDDYKSMTGQIIGLALAERELLDLEKAALEGEDLGD